MRSLAKLLITALVVLALAAGFRIVAPPNPVLAADDHGDYRNVSTPFDSSRGYMTGEIDQTPTGFDVDYFSFSAQRGERYTFSLEMGSVESANLTVVNAVARGIGSSEGQVTYQQGNQKKIEWTARTTDTYFVEVSADWDRLSGTVYLGTYTLRVDVDTDMKDRHSDTFNGATPIALGNQYQGAVSPWSNQPYYSGSVHGGDDKDYFSFLADRGVKYTIDVELGSAEGLTISVADATGSTVSSNDGIGTTHEWISPGTGTNYAVISGTTRVRDPEGTYAIRVVADTTLIDKHSQNRAGATPINFGNAQKGAISPAEDEDYFSFQTKRGHKYTVQVESGTAEGVGISIRSPGDVVEASNGGIGSTVRWIAPSSGTYYVAISASNQVRRVVGTYSLKVDVDTSLEDRHSENRVGATPINFGSGVAGAVSPEDDRDYFAFPAQRGVKYIIEAELGTIGNVEIAVDNPDGGSYVSNGGFGTTVEWIALEEATYYVVVSAPTQAAGSIGTYTLKVSTDTSLRDRHAEQRAGATPIDFGNAAAGAISPVGDRDYFSFSARRGVRYSVQAELGTAQRIGLSLDRTVQGTELSSDGISTELEWIAPFNQTYYIVVSAPPQLRETVGTYTLKVVADTSMEDRHAETSGNATLLGIGNEVTGAISPAEDVDYFSFPAKRGVRYTVSPQYGSAEAVSILLEDSDPTLEPVASNYGEGTNLSWIAPSDGLYYIAVSKSPRLEDPTGTYSLTIEADTSLEDRHKGGPGGATQLGFGNAIAGAISPADDYDYFAFPGEQGDKYTLQVALGTAEAVRITVINYRTGTTESNYGVGTSLQWTAPTTDTYVVVVSGSARLGDPVGTYNVTLIRGDLPPPAVPVATPVELPEPTPAPTPVPTNTPRPTPAPTGALLVAESRMGRPGGTVLLPIRLEKAQEVSSLGFNLNYDPSVVEVVKVMQGSRVSPALFSYNAEVPGVIRFGTAASESASGDGSAAWIEFKIIGPRGSSTPLTLSESLVTDSLHRARSIQLVHGTLTVGEPMTGDGNGDGRITAVDALIALKMFVGLKTEDLVMDMDGDGRVTPDDARRLLTMARRG